VFVDAGKFALSIFSPLSSVRFYHDLPSGQSRPAFKARYISVLQTSLAAIWKMQH
jgi:hypothetical protein